MKQILIIIVLLLNILFSQGEAGAVFLLISPSPTMNGMGEIGTCLPSDDIYSSYYNPANGISAFQGVSKSSSEMETRWLPNLADDLHLKYEVLGFGILSRNYPFQIVISQHRTYLDLGEQIRMGEHPEDYRGTFNSYMKANALIIGAKYTGAIKNIPIDLSVGMSRKTAIQYLYMTNFGSAESKEQLYDYGLLLSTKYQSSKLKTDIGYFNASLVPSFGYSMSNIADSITFYVGDPAPTILRTGLSMKMTIMYDNTLNIFKWSYGRMASDVMIDMTQLMNGKIRYQSGFGDIKFYENVILNKTDSSVDVHRGDEWTFFDTYSMRAGRRIDIDGQINISTSGYGYRLSGILKLLHYVTKDRVYEILQNHLDVRYNYSEYDEKPGHPLKNTDFEAWTVTIKNIDKLILKIFD